MQLFDCKGQFLSAFSTKGAASKQSFLVVSPSVLTSLFMCVTMGTNVCQCLRLVENLTSFGQFSSPTDIVVDDGFVYVSSHDSAGKIYIM